jgi:hypothetical protein
MASPSLQTQAMAALQAAGLPIPTLEQVQYVLGGGAIPPDLLALYLPVLGQFRTGTPYVPRTGLYQLHQGERVVVPAEENRRGGGAVALTIAPGAIVIQGVADPRENLAAMPRDAGERAQDVDSGPGAGAGSPKPSIAVLGSERWYIATPPSENTASSVTSTPSP